MGSTFYDWSPLTNALGGMIQQQQQKRQYDQLFQSLLGGGQAQGQGQFPIDPMNDHMAGPSQGPAPAQPVPAQAGVLSRIFQGMGGMFAPASPPSVPVPNSIEGPGGFIGQAPQPSGGEWGNNPAPSAPPQASPFGVSAQQLDVLRRLPPQIGMPLLMQVIGKSMAPDEYTLSPGQTRVRGNQVIAIGGPDPQRTQEDYNTLDKGSEEIQKALTPGASLFQGKADANTFRAPGLSFAQREALQAEGAQNVANDSPEGKARQVGLDAAARLPYERQLAQERDAAIEARANKAAEIDLTDPGDLSYVKSIANYKVRPPTAGRNPAVRKAVIEAALKINPDYQEAKFDQAAKALKDFGTGKQGDIARSLEVSVAHLDTLRDLGDALNNGNVTLINAAKQRFAEEFGVPAPTNFDAAKAIVADEVAKGVIGGQTAQADRETLAASLRRSGSPKAIEGAINTFQSLLKGQLGGLRRQYERTTGAKDFDETFLSERTRAALGGTAESSGGSAAPGTTSGRFKIEQIEGRAAGGPVHAGQPYLVGERGPEVVVPKQSGTVVPKPSATSAIAALLQAAMAARANPTLGVPRPTPDDPLARMIPPAVARTMGAR